MIKSAHLVATLVVFNVALAQAVYMSPPMLRTVCGAVADAEEAVGNSALAAGKAAVDMAMKPIAVIGGLQAAAVGTGIKVAGGAVKFVGAKMAKDGAMVEAAGAGIKGAGLGAAALGLKPAAEKIVAGANVAEKSLAAAKSIVGKVGDTSIQIGATIDSPFIGHHHKELEVTAGMDTALHNNLVQQVIPQQELIKEEVKSVAKRQFNQQLHAMMQDINRTLSSENQTSYHETLENEVNQSSEARDRRATPKLDLDVMRSAMNLVKEAKMEDCVALAVCDLNCNPQGFGNDGKQVFMNMVRLQGSSILEESESKYYKEAMNKGRSNSGRCEQCAQLYPRCTSKSTDLIKMASHIRMD